MFINSQEAKYPPRGETSTQKLENFIIFVLYHILLGPLVRLEMGGFLFESGANLYKLGFK